MKKIILLASALAFSSVALAKELHLVVIAHGVPGDPFWAALINGMNDAAKDLKVRVDFRSSLEGDVTKIAKLIESAVAQRVDGIITTVIDKDAFKNVLKKAKDLNIPFMTYNSGPEWGAEAGALTYVGSNEYQGGFEIGKAAKAAGAKSFVCVNNEITNTVLEQRCQGVADALGVKNNMLDVRPDPTDIKNKVTPYVGKVDAIVTIGPVAAAPVIQLLRERRTKDKPWFATFDLSQDITKAIKDGIITLAIDQQQYLQGYLPVLLMTKYLQYGVLPSGNTYTGPMIVDKNTVDLVIQYAGKYR